MEALRLRQEIPSDSDLHLVFRKLAKGWHVDDQTFDRVYPDWAARVSRLHWTPIPVIKRAVELLVNHRTNARVLDVGAGAGKFCLVGATISTAHFTGVEQRSHYAQLCRQLADHYTIPRTEFVNSDLSEVNWSRFNAVYLFNPFQEHKTPYQRIDGTVELHHSLYHHHVEFTQNQLRRMPTGTRVVTYHGFGGAFPETYKRVVQEYCYRGNLECWVKCAD